MLWTIVDKFISLFSRRQRRTSKTIKSADVIQILLREDHLPVSVLAPSVRNVVNSLKEILQATYPNESINQSRLIVLTSTLISMCTLRGVEHLAKSQEEFDKVANNLALISLGVCLELFEEDGIAVGKDAVIDGHAKIYFQFMEPFWLWLKVWSKKGISPEKIAEVVTDLSGKVSRDFLAVIYKKEFDRDILLEMQLQQILDMFPDVMLANLEFTKDVHFSKSA